MNKFSVVICIFQIFIFSSTSLAELDVSSEKEKVDLQLVLTIDLSPKVYERGEAFSIVMKLTNLGIKNINVNTWLFNNPSLIKTKINGPKGILKKTIHISYKSGKESKENFHVLEPGKSFSRKLYSENIQYNFLGHKIKDLGEYDIQIEYSNDFDGKEYELDNVFIGSLKSNIIKLYIVKNKKLGLLREKYENLYKKITPPIDTKRKEIEYVYGKSLDYVISNDGGKVEYATYKYELRSYNELITILNVGYQDGIAKKVYYPDFSDLISDNNFCFYKNKEAEDLMRRYETVIRKFEIIKKEYSNKLNELQWEKVN